MSNTTPIASGSSESSSDLNVIIDASLKAYKEKTKKDLKSDPLMAQLKACKSPADILAVLRTQVQQFEQSTAGDDKLTKWLNPIVNVLFASSSVIGAGVGLVNPIRMILQRSNL